MDGGRLDHVARALAEGVTRRAALGSLGAAVAGLLARRPATAACIDPWLPCLDTDTCCLGYSCRGGICDCPSGQFNLDGSCFLNDETCLQPGAGCQIADSCCSGYSCFNGACDCPSALFDDAGNCLGPVGPCVGGGLECGSDAPCCAGFECGEGICLQVVSLICRGIGEECGVDGDCCAEANATCHEGICTCLSSQVLIVDQGICTGQCAFPGETCDDSMPCCGEAGACRAGICQCDGNERVCGARCVERSLRFQRDPTNCGERGVACAEGDICCAGQCHPAEILQSAADLCGSCCTACHADEVCCQGKCQTPFIDIDGQSVCCPDAQVCAAPDGAEACCAEGDTCLSGVCCPAVAVCGDTCCEPGTFCHCGTCVTDLATCVADTDCCTGWCLAGYCCPATAICFDENGGGVCCGGLSVCDVETNICLVTEARPLRPTRPGR